MATAHHEVIRYPHDFAPKNRANVSPSGNEGIREGQDKKNDDVSP